VHCSRSGQKLNGEHYPKGTEHQIQPSANGHMNQLSNIVLLGTTVNSLCMCNCQVQRKKNRQETPHMLLFTATASLHQNLSYSYIIPRNIQKYKPVHEGCLSSNVNYH